MRTKLLLLLSIFALSLTAAEKATTFGVVNFSTCVTDSKAGKQEQEQMEKIKGQWNQVIQDTQKELSTLEDQFKNQDYMDGLSPEAVTEMENKRTALNEDLMKYQSQLYQSLNQANYFLLQKLYRIVMEASEVVAKEKAIDIVLNSESRFFHTPKLEITTEVVKEMDKKFDQEQATKKTETSKKTETKETTKKK